MDANLTSLNLTTLKLHSGQWVAWDWLCAKLECISLILQSDCLTEVLSRVLRGCPNLTSIKNMYAAPVFNIWIPMPEDGVVALVGSARHWRHV